MDPRRPFALLAILLVAPVATLPSASALDVCGKAVLLLRGVLEDAAGELTPEVALALGGAVQSCGLPPVDPDDIIPLVTVVMKPLLARDCDLLEPATASADAAPIRVYYQVSVPFVPVNQPEEDVGPATATFDPSSNLTAYSVRGEKWGLDAVNGQPGVPGHATVYLHGVPIPATPLYQQLGTGRGMARAGCTPETLGQMCWASGEATVRVSTLIAIDITSDFRNC